MRHCSKTDWEGGIIKDFLRLFERKDKYPLRTMDQTKVSCMHLFIAICFYMLFMLHRIQPLTCSFSPREDALMKNKSELLFCKRAIWFRVGISKTKLIRKKFRGQRGKRPAVGKKLFGFANHFMKNAKSFNKFCELIWTNMYYELRCYSTGGI